MKEMKALHIPILESILEVLVIKLAFAESVEFRAEQTLGTKTELGRGGSIHS